MDILNFISWIKGGRVVTTVDPTQTLLPVGLKDSRRDDGYLAGAISVEDFANQVGGLQTVAVDGVTITGDGTPGDPLVAAGGSSYKVYTALLTQSGTSNPTVIVLQNTMTSPVVITRFAQGNYTVACNDFNFFTVNKTAISAISANGNMLLARTKINNPTTFRIETFDYSATNPYLVTNDDCLAFSMLEVRVYP